MFQAVCLLFVFSFYSFSSQAFSLRKNKNISCSREFIHHSPRSISVDELRKSRYDFTALHSDGELLWQPLRFNKKTGFHKYQLRKYQNRQTKEVLMVKEGAPHTLFSEVAGQRIFKLLGFPVPHTELVTVDGQYWLAMEFMDGYKNGVGDMKLCPEMMGALFADLLIFNYDRNGGNIMHHKDKGFVFIDEGASFGSRAGGGIIGYPEKISFDQLYFVATGGKFGTHKVNSSYAKLVDIKALSKNRLTVFDSSVMQMMLKKIAEISDEQIDAIMDISFGKEERESSLLFVEQNLADLESYPEYDLSYGRSLALDSYRVMKKNFKGSQRDYYSWALKMRRDSFSFYFQ